MEINYLTMTSSRTLRFLQRNLCEWAVLISKLNVDSS